MSVASRYYCTYFDSNYMARALVLHDSLLKWSGSVRLFALCLDDRSFKSVERLGMPTLVPISFRTLEAADPDLARVRPSRSLVEYYYTCGPSFLLYLLAAHPEIDLLTHVDADMCFFASPEPVFQELAGSSTGITEHRFSKRHEARLKFGRFNVGWLSFRNDHNGRACIEWWRERCIEWCYERFDNDRYADQKYLDDWPARFGKVCVIQHKGVNVAPWNVGRYSIREAENRVWIEDQPLICFHFHGFKRLSPYLFDTNLGRSGAMVSPVLRRAVCGAYIRGLERYAAGVPATGSVRKQSFAMRALRAARNMGCALVSSGYVLKIGDRLI